MARVTIALVCLAPFVAWGKAFGPGEEIPQDVASQWPEGTLETRLANGFIKQEIKQETRVEKDAADLEAAREKAPPPPKWQLFDTELEGMTKAQLVAFASEHFPDEALLDASQTKADLMVELAGFIAARREQP